jgi:hypothetical protein
MKALLIALSLILGIGVSWTVPTHGAPAVLLCAGFAVLAGIVIYQAREYREFLLLVFISGLLVRVFVATLTFVFNLQDFFASDTRVYDNFGYTLLRVWQGELPYRYAVSIFNEGSSYWGMLYMVAAIYGVVGRNVLAVQFINAVLGAATAPIIFLCAQHIFQNTRVARLSAFIVAFFPLFDPVVVAGAQRCSDHLFARGGDACYIETGREVKL